MAGVCSGVGGFDLAFERAGFDVLWNCEKESACQRVLVERFEKVLLQFEDMTSDDILTAPAPLVFAGGTPCQGFSVAGLRKGLNDDRSNLALRFLQLCDHFKPRVILWENVPGVLSDKENAFGHFLAGLVGADAVLVPPTECGGRWTNAGLVVGPKRTAAWRILDSQFFGVAQRRERVFVVASPRAELPFQILFEPEGVRRHSPPSREAGQRVALTVEGRAGRSGCNNFATSGGLVEYETAPTLSASGRGVERAGESRGQDPLVIQAFGGGNTAGSIDVATCCTTKNQRIDFDTETFIAHALRAEGFDASEDGTGRGTPLVPVAFEYKKDGDCHGDLAPTLRATEHSQSHANGGGHVAVIGAFKPNQGASSRGIGYDTDVSPTLEAAEGGNNKPAVHVGYAVRRLTPRECERLQAFPDDWSLVPNAKGKPMADGPRYRMMGNAVTVSTVEWIAKRIRALI
jgi:DNA (cytosine-5)-methyltransferase 1